MALQVDVQQKARGAYIVSPSGSLDTATFQEFDSRIEPILAENIDLLVFDLENLEYISSAGISSILRARHAVRKNNGNVRFINLQPQIQKVFDIIKAIPSMQIFAGVEELDAYLDMMQQRVKVAGNNFR